MESKDVLIYGDEPVDPRIVKALNKIGVSTIHHKDTKLDKIQRSVKDPEVAVYARLLNMIVVTSDISNPSFEEITSYDVNGKEVKEDPSNNRILIRNRFMNDCFINIKPSDPGKYRMSNGPKGHNGIIKYMPSDINNIKDVDKLAKGVKSNINDKDIHESVKELKL